MKIHLPGKWFWIFLAAGLYLVYMARIGRQACSVKNDAGQVVCA
jgi:hypothetical protein